MTEDDTFRKLRKPSFIELRDMINKIPDENWILLNDSQIDALVETYGWTWKEWIDANMHWIKNRM